MKYRAGRESVGGGRAVGVLPVDARDLAPQSSELVL
jgi:hypothetical protein